MAVECRAPLRSPKIDRHEEEEPDNVNEVPIPCGKFETEMLLWSEMALRRAKQAHGEEDRTNQHMEAMEAGRHKECRAIDIAAK